MKNQSSQSQHAGAQSAFTPGPWNVIDAAVYTADRSVRICDPFDAKRATFGPGGGCEKMLPIDERSANAQLIASAPELLSALQRVLDFEQRLTACPSDGGPALVSDIRSVIAKATQP